MISCNARGLFACSLFNVSLTLMASNGSIEDDQGPIDGQDESRKRRKRYIRSKNGCLTCRARKVKCGEERPVCTRCETEERECSYHENQSQSPGRTALRQQQHRLYSTWSQPAESTPYASTSRLGPSVPSPAVANSNASLDHNLNTQEGRVGAVEPTQYDDWLAYLFDSSSQSALHSDLETSISEWMSNNTLFLSERRLPQPNPTTNALQRQHVLPFHTNSEVEDGLSPEQRQKLADSNLQRRLRELCTSEIQLEAVSQFFNFVAQSFHLLSAEVNSWRRVYAELSCQSALTLNLVTSVGLISLSISGRMNRRALAYGLLTKSISEWQRIVNAGYKSNFADITEIQVLEIIAGAILIGHVEQFDTGIAIHTIACMKETRKVVDAVVDGHNSKINMNSGSHFRFLIRSFLWWDTLSRTMGMGSGGLYPKNAFEMVRSWEQQDDEDAISMTQGHIGWPLDLLEAVARTQALADHQLGSNDARKSSSWTRNEMKSIESQIRNCRPRVVSQDSVLIAELRYVVYEALQAGAHIYFARKLLGETKSVQKEVEKVTGFLNRRDIKGSNGDSDVVQQQEQQHHHHHPHNDSVNYNALEEEEFDPPTNSPQSRPNYLTNVMEKRGVWKERAPDGALLWSYLQSAMAVDDTATQNACRQTLSRWEAFKEIGAVSLQFELLELIWEKKRNLRVRPPWSEEDIWNKVLEERRWRQLLIF